MTTIIKLKKKGVSGSDPSPGDLVHGELAINFADGKLYYKNSSNAIARFLDSGQTVSMIDSAYINDRINSNYLDSAETINLVDSAYVNARLDDTLFLDSAEAINLVDSAYVNARLDTTLFLDSAETISLVDSAYVNARLNTTLFLDSAEAISLVDSAYVNARLDTTLFLDSAEAIALVDSAYVNARLDTTSFLDSAEAIALVDSAYVNARLDDTLFLDSAEAHNILDSMFGNLDQHLIPITNEIYDLGTSTKRFRDLYLSGTSVTFGNIVMSEHAGAARFTNHSTGAEVKVDVSNVNTHLIDSSIILGLIDSAYVDPLVESLGYRDSAQIENIITANYINDRINQNYLNSAETISIIDSAYVNARLNTTSFLDSAEAIQLVDSAYVNARLNSALFLDSAEAINLVDSAYIQARQLNFDQLLDSAEVTQLVDSSYIQARTRIGLDDINFGSKKILYSNLYSTEGDLPSASTYHGMFAHVHGTGRGYFAHGGNWVSLVDNNNFASKFNTQAPSFIDSSYIQTRTRIGLDDINFGSKRILYSNLYSQTSDLPSASTYHGMFAHVHGTGKGYFAHGGNWVELANASELFGGAFSDLSGKPTTIAGYGITDAFSGAYADLTGKPSLLDSALTTSLIDSAYVQLRQAAGGATFGLAGNTGTHTFNTTTETLTFLGTTGQINAGIAANNLTLSLDPNINSIVSIAFEGSTANNNETKLQAVDPTADRTINLPDATGHLPVFATASPAAITDGTSGQALVTNGSGQLSFTTISGGGGSAITVQDEGSSLSTAATTLNFVGSGVAASGTGGTKTITISGGGGGSSANVNTDVVVNTFNGDSSTTAFTLSSEPSTDQNVFVTINGVSQHIDAYSLSGTTLTMSAAPENGDVIEARTVRSTNVELRDHKDYIYQPNPASSVFSGSDVNGDVLSYDVNKLEVFFNGSRLTPGLDFTATNGTSVTVLTDYNADSNDTVVISSFSKASLVDTGITPKSASIGTAATQYVADTYSATTHRTSKFLIELAVDSDNKYHATEVLLTHNGTTVFMSQYGHVTSDSSLGEFDADINSGNVRLLVTPSLNDTTIKTQRITIGA